MMQTQAAPVRRTQARAFARHAVGAPIVCRRDGGGDPVEGEMCDIGFGGLAFASRADYTPGDVVDVSYPTLHGDTRLTGEVVWQRPDGEGHRVATVYGIRFARGTLLYRARLIEQICRTKQAVKRGVGR